MGNINGVFQVPCFWRGLHVVYASLGHAMRWVNHSPSHMFQVFCKVFFPCCISAGCFYDVFSMSSGSSPLPHLLSPSRTCWFLKFQALSPTGMRTHEIWSLSLSKPNIMAINILFEGSWVWQSVSHVHCTLRTLLITYGHRPFSSQNMSLPSLSFLMMHLFYL